MDADLLNATETGCNSIREWETAGYKNVILLVLMNYQVFVVLRKVEQF
jgi:hypothetical protein